MALIPLVSSTFDCLAQAIILSMAVAALWLTPTLSSVGSIRCGWLLLTIVLIMALCACVELVLRTAVMADVAPGEAWGFVPRVLAHSEYGFYWQWRVGVWVTMLLVTLWILGRGWSGLSAWLLIITSLMTMLLVSVTSHAGEEGVWSIINLVNWLHLASISLWGGAVVIYAFLVMPELHRIGSADQTVVAIENLSTLATAVLGLVLMSGIFNSWRQLNELSDLWTTSYGWVLTIKLALVVIMMAIGAINRFYWVPRLIAVYREEDVQWESASIHFLRVLQIDSAIFIAVLILAIVLGGQSPPVHAR